MARDIDPGRPRIVIGRIGRTHGVKGWVKLQSWTSPAENILEYAHLLVETENGPRRLRIDHSRWQGSNLLVHFEEYDEPEIARALTGCEVAVEASELPELETGEYYWHQLQGLQVINLAGENFGRSVFCPPWVDRQRLIPFVRERVVRNVDLEAGTIEVDWGADFLAQK